MSLCKHVILAIAALSLVISFVALSSCSVIPFKTQRVDGEFQGISNTFSETERQIVNILTVHGLGQQDSDYSDKFILAFINLLNSDFRRVGTVRIEYGYERGFVDITKYTLNNIDINFYSVYWSDVTQEEKSWLYRNHYETNGRRTALNNYLQKQIVINNFADFVLYASPEFHSLIQYPVIQTLRLMYRLVPADMSNSHVMTFNYIVSGSLGTRMAIDALNISRGMLHNQNMKLNQQSAEAVNSNSFRTFDTICASSNYNIDLEWIDEAAISKIKCQLGYSVMQGYEDVNVNAIYSLSNQLPLLGLLDLSSIAQPSYQSYLDSTYSPICNFLGNDTSHFELINFYDPSDILGFLMDYPLSDSTSCNGGLHVSRCTVNNAVPILGILASPYKAHVGGWNNRKVVKKIVYGYPKK